MRPAWWSFLPNLWAVRPALAFAVMLVVISATAWWWQRSGERTQYAAIAQALVADHIHYAHTPDPFEIASADPGTVSSWFHDRVPFAVRVPQLSDGRLLGGRRCSPLGHLGAAVFYERAGKRFSLFTLAPSQYLSFYSFPRWRSPMGAGCTSWAPWRTWTPSR